MFLRYLPLVCVSTKVFLFVSRHDFRLWAVVSLGFIFKTLYSSIFYTCSKCWKFSFQFCKWMKISLRYTVMSLKLWRSLLFHLARKLIWPRFQNKFLSYIESHILCGMIPFHSSSWLRKSASTLRMSWCSWNTYFQLAPPLPHYHMALTTCSSRWPSL